MHTGIGMSMWVLGAVFTGVSQSYGFLLFARIFMGAGAATFPPLRMQHHRQDFVTSKRCMCSLPG
jgi:hypothetical protein